MTFSTTPPVGTAPGSSEDILRRVRRVPAAEGFPSVDDLLASFARIADENPGLVTTRRVGTSRRGESIPGYSIGSGERSYLVVGGVHPNEPIGFLTALHLLEQLIADPALLEASSGTWHVIPCIDPDGARLNEGWYPAPQDRNFYARRFYRPEPDQQVEWTFPTSYKNAYFDRMMPETQALAREIDRVKPDLYVALHNGEMGGVLLLPLATRSRASRPSSHDSRGAWAFHSTRASPSRLSWRPTRRRSSAPARSVRPTTTSSPWASTPRRWWAGRAQANTPSDTEHCHLSPSCPTGSHPDLRRCVAGGRDVPLAPDTHECPARGGLGRYSALFSPRRRSTCRFNRRSSRHRACLCRCWPRSARLTARGPPNPVPSATRPWPSASDARTSCTASACATGGCFSARSRRSPVAGVAPAPLRRLATQLETLYARWQTEAAEATQAEVIPIDRLVGVQVRGDPRRGLPRADGEQLVGRVIGGRNPRAGDCLFWGHLRDLCHGVRASRRPDPSARGRTADR